MPRDKATTTEDVVTAAAVLFVEKGYRNSTIDDICEAAGISRPILYKYIESKSWLLDQMVLAVTDELEARLRTLLESEVLAAERLRQTVHLHIEAATTKRAFYATVFSEQSEMSDTSRAHFQAWSHRITRDFAHLIEECFDASSTESGADASVLANLLLTMLTSLYRWYDPRGQVTPLQLADQVIRLMRGSVPGL